MRESPAITVVVPLFNKRESIGRAVDSVLRQTVRDIELLVVDDGSTDGSGDVVEAVCDPRVRLIRQANAGPNRARNNAVEVARSGLVAFLDGDDEWTPVHLANILDARARYPACGAFATNFYWVLLDGGVRHPEFPGLRPENGFCLIDNYFAVSKSTSVMTCSSVALTKQVLAETGGFPATEFVKQAQPLWVKIALNHQICFSVEPSLIYHLDAENRWDAHIQRIKRHLEDCDTVLLKTLDDALVRRDYRNQALPIEDIRAYRRRVLFWRASDLIRIGQRGRGRIAALRSLATAEYFGRSLGLIARSLKGR